jgi:DNA-binding NarL/FixJ family response regulator
MDVRLPDGSGIEACREIRAERPETRVVMLTSYPDERQSSRRSSPARPATSSSRSARGDLVAALETVANGGSPARSGGDREGARAVRRMAGGGATDELAQLTSQERKILAP